MHRVIGSVVVLGLVWGGAKAYEATRANVCIHVDNVNGDAALAVSVEGQEAVTVPAGEVGKVECRACEKRVTVTRGEETVFAAVKTLKAPDVGETTRYLFNPGGRNRYWVHPILYGNQWSLGDRKDYEDKYEQLADRIELVPAEEWIELAKGDFVLEEVPDSIRVDTSTYGAMRYEVRRLERPLYDVLAAARQQKDWTEEQYRQLSEVVQKLYEAVEE